MNTDQQQILTLYNTLQEAVVEKDLDTIVRHIDGHTQTMDEWLALVEDETRKHYSIDVTRPKISINKNHAKLECRSVIDARIYGSRGTWTLPGSANFEKTDGIWRMMPGM